MASSNGLDSRPSFINLDKTIVKVKVGEECFPFHKGLLCSYSPFFRKAFDGHFREAEEGIVTLNDTDAETAKRFMDWLYYDQMTLPELEGRDEISSNSATAGDDSSQEEAESLSVNNAWRPTKKDVRAANRCYELLLNLYIFADRYEVYRLRNAILTQWRQVDNIYNPSAGCAIIARAWELLPPTSSLCRYLVDSYALEGGPPYYEKITVEEDMERLPKDFLIRALIVSKCASGDRFMDEDVERFYESDPEK